MKERRHFDRIFFSADDKVTGSLTHADSQEISMNAAIMDLSPSGMRLTVSKDKYAPLLKEGEYLIMVNISGAQELDRITPLKMEIRWLLNHPSFHHIGIGCHFSNPSPQITEHIRAFMESWTKDLPVTLSEEADR